MEFGYDNNFEDGRFSLSRLFPPFVNVRGAPGPLSGAEVPLTSPPLPASSGVPRKPYGQEYFAEML